jgi:DNA-binding response OmpR family regulator
LRPKKRKVLIVEDDPTVRVMLRSYLGVMGHEVVEAGDGKAGIAELERSRPDLLCLDLMLPESSGYDVCEYVRKSETFKELPILIISARTLPADRAFAEEVGASAFLTKPFTRAELTKAVNEMLGEAKK